MNLYFFRNAPKEYRRSIVLESVKKNLILVRIASWILIAITSLILLSQLVFDYKTLAQKNALLIINSFFLFFSLKSLIVGFLLHKNLDGKRVVFARVFCFLFALCVITGGLWISLIAQNNPRNTMTMYALAAISIAVLWLFEYTETLAIMLICQVIFSISLAYYQDGLIERVLNHFVSFFLLGSFFFISRWIYSLHLNHYIQVQQIAEKNNLLEQAALAKTDILGIVAHDLRNPLSNIEMLVSMSLNEDLPPEENREHLNLILSSCRNSRTIINDLIEFARDNDSQVLHTQKVIMQDFVTGIYLEWKQNLGESRSLRIMMDDKPLSAHINPDKLRRVLDNLISNAVKFTHQGGQILIELSNVNGLIQIAINDDGVGIPQNLMPYIFDRFSKAGRSGLHGETSIGLGLSITKKIVTQHKGTIQARNNERGTTFSVELPVA